VNDILVHGARPLFFLDYIGAGRLDPNIVGRLIDGMVGACTAAHCALIGGETAEMPGMYAPGELDLVGCIIGDVRRSEIVDGRGVVEGDRVIGIPSDGLHTNGYSLARRILLDEARLAPNDSIPEVGETVAHALLRRHRMYLPMIEPFLGKRPLHAMAHITGGGIPGNLPRVLPEGLRARLESGSWSVPPLFRAIQKLGKVEESEMFQVFNMGIGYVLVVPAETESDWLGALASTGCGPVRIGNNERGGGGVVWDDATGPI
jgi:phosphoribosylformylglycinamidine cyclo-ligase